MWQNTGDFVWGALNTIKKAKLARSSHIFACLFNGLELLQLFCFSFFLHSVSMTFLILMVGLLLSPPSTAFFFLFLRFTLSNAATKLLHFNFTSSSSCLLHVFFFVALSLLLRPTPTAMKFQFSLHLTIQKTVKLIRFAVRRAKFEFQIATTAKHFSILVFFFSAPFRATFMHN